MPSSVRPPGGLNAIVSIVVALAVGAATGARADEALEPTVTDIALSFGPSPKLSFRGLHLIDPQVRAALENGARAKVYFSVEVDRVRSLWMDESIVDISFRHRLRYDQATEQWLVRMEGPLIPAASFEEAQEMLARVELDLPVGSLDPAQAYEVRVRIECNSLEQDLPLGIQNILPFLSGWGFDTGWIERSVP